MNFCLVFITALGNLIFQNNEKHGDLAIAAFRAEMKNTFLHSQFRYLQGPSSLFCVHCSKRNYNST